jgi:hypothetical protein
MREANESAIVRDKRKIYKVEKLIKLIALETLK